MKKKLLFVMNNMNCGGAEQALLSLLKTMDYSRYDVDLYLFKHEGMFLSRLPDEVQLLPEPSGYSYFDMSVKQAVLSCMRGGMPRLAIARLKAGYLFRAEKNAARREQRMWKHLSQALPELNKEYDAAIGYLEKSPAYYVIEKVRARTKIGFIHNDYNKLGMDARMDIPYFKQLDLIVTVSEQCVRILQDNFPQFTDKIKLMHNIISPKAIIDLSLAEQPPKKEGLTIVSVGRLNPQKGFEIAVEACARLVEDGYPIRWYIIGEGMERGRLEQLIAAKGLEQAVILTGAMENPYPYMKHCDIYVQTSLFEGRCLTVTEAKILHKPIVSTNFTVIYDQLTHEENGLIVGMNGAEVYEGIKRLLDDPALCRHLIDRLQRETLGTEEEIKKLYQWIS